MRPVSELLQEVIDDHSYDDPGSWAYQECDKDPCVWCDDAKDAIERLRWRYPARGENPGQEYCQYFTATVRVRSGELFVDERWWDGSQWLAGEPMAWKFPEEPAPELEEVTE